MTLFTKSNFTNFKHISPFNSNCKYFTRKLKQKRKHVITTTESEMCYKESTFIRVNVSEKLKNIIQYCDNKKYQIDPEFTDSCSDWLMWQDVMWQDLDTLSNILKYNFDK